MFRALDKYFGSEPDLDIEAQRAIVVLKKPMPIDWKHIDEIVRDANYTFGGAHLRTRGRIVQAQGGPPNRLEFEFVGSGQRIAIKNSESARSAMGKTVEVAARIDEWNATPELSVLGNR